MHSFYMNKGMLVEKFLIKELYLLWSDEAKESKGPDIP